MLLTKGAIEKSVMKLAFFDSLKVNHEPASAVDDELVAGARTRFPNLLPLADAKTDFYVAHVCDIPTQDLVSFIDLIDNNIGSFYRDVEGPRWTTGKWFEMNEDHLIYVWYKRDDELVAFLSFMYTDSEHENVLYLYEIHVNKLYHSNGIGGILMTGLHDLARQLGSRCKSTNLTVFSNNILALEWYRRLGYVLTGDSPTDKVLRSGKIRKPVYYLMKRLS